MARDEINWPKGLKRGCGGGEGKWAKNTNFEMNDNLPKDNIWGV